MQEMNRHHLQEIVKSILAIVKTEGGQSVESFVRLQAGPEVAKPGSDQGESPKIREVC